MKKTIYLSDKKETVNNSKWDYECPYIFYDKRRKKWLEDTWYFNDEEEVFTKAKREGYTIA